MSKVKTYERSERLIRHHRCRICGTMIGYKHGNTPQKINGITYCSHCYEIWLFSSNTIPMF